jgi:DNA-binding response OmpR family regulator
MSAFIWLPSPHPPLAGIPDAVLAAMQRSPASKPRPRRVLLVEDDPAIADMYRLQLEMDGYEVLVAMEGGAGLELMRSGLPDIVLLDVRMPGMDGFQVLKAASEDVRLRGIPVVLLTNYGAQEMRETGRELGAIDYVVKSQAIPAWVSQRIPEWIRSTDR